MKEEKTPKKKFSWRYLLAGICFVLAALFFAADPIRNMLLAQHQADYALSAQPVTAQEIKDNSQKDASFDFDKVESINLQNVVAAKLDTSNYLTVGAIAVPSVGMNLPIYRGLANEALLAGAGTMKPDQVMGEGNYALAGHHYPASPSVLFSPLMNLKVGDTIYITDLENIYEYKTETIDLVDIYQVHVVDDRPGQTEITLVTCNDDATLRYIYKGKFVSKTPITQATQAMSDAFGIDLTTAY